MATQPRKEPTRRSPVDPPPWGRTAEGSHSLKTRELNGNSERSFVVVLDTGDEVVDSLLAFAREHRVTAGRFTGLGAFSSVVLGFFDFDQKDYHRNKLDEQVEVATLVGDFAVKGGEVKIHAHVVVADRDGRAYGGHLLEARVKPTLEVMVVDAPESLRRVSDEATGLALLQV